VRLADHHYAPEGQDVAPGELLGVIVRGPGPLGPDVLVGSARVDFVQRRVALWQVSRPGGGWIDGPTWESIDEAVEIASDPRRLAALVRYVEVRDEAWVAHRRAAELDRQAAALLAAAIEGTDE
jgi:hypothetical protein